jgi:hypothetical protein
MPYYKKRVFNRGLGITIYFAAIDGRLYTIPARNLSEAPGFTGGLRDERRLACNTRADYQVILDNSTRPSLTRRAF